MNYKKVIWELFQIKRDEFNKFDKKVESILISIYEKGKNQGRREEGKRIKSLLKH